MIAAEPVINNYRQTLLKAGTVLRDSHKNLLKTWNILSIRIKADEDDEVSDLGVELQQLCIERLSKRMAWKPRNEYERAIVHLGILRAAQIIQKKENKSL